MVKFLIFFNFIFFIKFFYFFENFAYGNQVEIVYNVSCQTE